MAWLGQFKIGRPALEHLFEVNPASADFDHQRIDDSGRGLTGRLLVVTTSRDRPSIRLTGNYLPPRMLNMLRHLPRIDDTPLVFEPIDSTGNQVFEVWQDKLTPLTTTTLRLAEDSYQRAAELRANAGGATVLAPAGVWRQYLANSSEGGGTNYWFSASTYSDDFDARVLGDLAGQDSWVDLIGGGLLVVSNLLPIAGTKSVRINHPAGPGVAVYRRLLTFPGGDYSFRFKMRWDGGSQMLTRASSSDSIMASTNSWEVLANGSLGQLNISVKVGSVSPAIIVPISGLNTPHSFEVRRVAGILSFNVDEVQIYSAAETVAPNRIMMAAGNVGGPELGSAWDDLALSTTGTGTYNAITNLLTLGTPLPDLSPVYCTFRATAFACEVSRIPARTEGGWGSDLWKYGGLDLVGG